MKRARPTPAPDQALLPGFEDPSAPSSPEDDRNQHHTLFFALRPDDAAADVIAARRGAIRASHGIGGKEVARDRLHITLFGVERCPGALPAVVVDGARSIAGGVNHESFDVVLDGAVTFEIGRQRRPLVLLASKEANAPLMLFQRRIAAAMAGIGRKSPFGQSFTPHLTLLYGDERMAQEPIEPVRWTVHEFVLIESLPGQTIHHTLGCWPVGGKA